MLFNSWEFLCLLFVTFSVYYLVPFRSRYAKGMQVILVLISSAIFYGWEDPRLLILLSVSCIGNSIATGLIIKKKSSNQDSSVDNIVRLAVISNLLLLGIFKYASFALGLLPGIPKEWITLVSNIPLPIGISFYTFHGISMIIDVARGEVVREGDQIMSGESSRRPINSFLVGVRDIGFYLLFFPQLVAGPIVKAKQFWPQIGWKRFVDINWNKVIKSVILGYFLKMVVADNIAEQTIHLTTSNITFMSSVDLVFLLYGYSFQIFADFAGYSLIAIGLAGMFGYEFPINFNFPYLATSITEFWKRWHMSLSSWLRDYLYIPLGGNRKGEVRTYVNLFLVMFLGGLWHGSEWKFAIWGVSHGLLLGVERIVGSRFRKSGSKISKFIGWAYTFHIVTILWLTFLMPDINQFLMFFRQFNNVDKIHGPYIFAPLFFGGFVVLYHIYNLIKISSPWFARKFENRLIEGSVYGFLLFLIVTNSGAPQGFIYFQF